MMDATMKRTKRGPLISIFENSVKITVMAHFRFEEQRNTFIKHFASTRTSLLVEHNLYFQHTKKRFTMLLKINNKSSFK